MNRDDIHKLLGGYATDTLTADERRVLFEAALSDQELFNALSDEQALREYLSDPRFRSELLHAVRPSAKPQRTWFARPAAWALAGALAVAVIAVVMVRSTTRRPAASEVVAEIRRDAVPPPPFVEAPPPSSSKLAGKTLTARSRAVLSVPAAPAQQNQESESARAPAGQQVQVTASPSAIALNGAPDRKTVAILTLDAGTAKAERTQELSKSLADKLTKDGVYLLVDQTKVDKAVEEQKMTGRPIDAAAAAGIGRSVGADAVILSNVNPADGAQMAVHARAKKQATMAITTQMIDSKTGQNLRQATASGDQMKQAAVAIGTQLGASARVEGRVTEINAGTASLDIGTKAGVKAGDHLDALRGGERIGEVVITTASDASSLATFTGPIQIGDVVTSAPAKK